MALRAGGRAGAAAPPRIKILPKSGARVVPRELKPCVRLRRLDAVRGGPRTATYGLAEVCRMVIPAARTMRAVRNKENEGAMAAGTKSSAPQPIVTRPATMDRA